MEQIKKAADSEQLPTANIEYANIIAKIRDNVKPRPDMAATKAAIAAITDTYVLKTVAEFCENRMEIKNPMTVLALKKLCNKLSKISGEPAIQIAMLDKAITAGWSGVYPLSDSELKAIKQQAAENERRTSYDINKIKKQFNDFDGLGW